MGLSKVDRRTLSDAVFDQLSREIVGGNMQPGAFLPSERELVSVLGVNRGAVREALQRLAHSGLVQIQQGGGTRVLDYRQSAGLDLLGRLMMRTGGDIDVQVARSVMEMRSALAVDVARLAAQRREDTALEPLAAQLAAMESTDDLSELQLIALQFWDLLVEASGNVAYRLAFNTLRETYELIRGALVIVMADEVSDVAGHRQVFDAVAARRPQRAREAAAALVERGAQRVFALLDALADEQTSPHEDREDSSSRASSNDHQDHSKGAPS